MKNKVGAPKKEIDWNELDKLCGIHATKQEIADWFEVSEDTIERRCKEERGVNFAVYYSRKTARGKMSLRRKQYEVAMNGNVRMLEWLGKQYLSQKDKLENTVIDLTEDETKELVKEAQEIAKQLK